MLWNPKKQIFPKKFWTFFLTFYLVSCFTRKKFIHFNKFMVKCEWKKCLMKEITYIILCLVPEQGGGGLDPWRAIEGSFSAWGGLGKPDRGLGHGETFFPDSSSDRDSDETFLISRNLLEHVEFFCLLDSQPWLCIDRFSKVLLWLQYSLTPIIHIRTYPEREGKFFLLSFLSFLAILWV